MQKNYQNRNVRYRVPKGGSAPATPPPQVSTSSTISNGRPASVVNVSSMKPVGAGAAQDTIRIVVRDAKPPKPARALQFVMRGVCFVLLVLVCCIGIPRFCGINEFNILTGSMQPDYPVGTLVFVQAKDPSSIRPGEVVSYVMNEDLDIITHRCVSNDYDNKMLGTRGDANTADDAPVLYENVVGIVVFSVPYVGAVVDYLTNDNTGRALAVSMLATVLALTFLAEMLCSYLTKQSADVFAKGKKQGANVTSKTKKGKDKHFPPRRGGGGHIIRAVDSNTGKTIAAKTV